jgi:DNA-binding NtrC family response regulator
VEIPPLRERRDDVPLLVEHFLRRFCPQKQVTLTPAAERSLMRYDWPGNVRELRNIVQRLALFADGEVRVEDLPPEVRDDHAMDALVKACTRCLIDESLTYTQVVACLEANLLRQALAEAGGNRSQAARILGLSLSTLRDKLKKHGFDDTSE